MVQRITIREASHDDMVDVLSVIRAAFGSDEEAQLVSDLLNDKSAEPIVSLLALKDDKIVGHILFTGARSEPELPVSMTILAPLAVAPHAQNRGIGGKLVKCGCQLLSQTGTDVVFVLGHSAYYPRFGFTPAGVLGFDAPYPIPEGNTDAWMVKFLREESSAVMRARIICADTMQKPEYWRE